MSKSTGFDDDFTWKNGVDEKLRNLSNALWRKVESPPEVFVVGEEETLFQNNWINFDGTLNEGTERAEFYKDRNRVYLSGFIRAGASGTVAFTLPEGFRTLVTTGPIRYLTFANSNNGVAYVLVHSDGRVIPTNLPVTSNPADVASGVVLDGISFRTV